MSPIHLKSNEKTMVVGVNDMGKSVLFRYLIRIYLELGIEVLYYDSEKEGKLQPAPNLKIYTPEEPANVPEFDAVCAQVWERGNMVIAIESIDFYADYQKPMPPSLKKIIHWGRNRRIGVLMTSRRIANVHKDCCALNRHWFLFHCYLPNDIKYIRSFIGKPADQLPKLDPYYFIHWSGGKSELCNPIPYEGDT